jgi:hypothetical protein
MSDVKTHIVKNSDGTLSLGTTQDVSEILKQNKFEADNNVNRKNTDTFGRKVASIPLNVVNAWCKEWGVTYEQFLYDPEVKVKMFARLRDPEYQLLRTDLGQI